MHITVMEWKGWSAHAHSIVTTPSLVPSEDSVREAEHCIGASALSLPSLGQLVRGNVPLPIPECVSKSVNMKRGGGGMEGEERGEQKNEQEIASEL